MAAEEVLVVGGGIAGVACARVLHDAGVRVRVRDRGRRLGGRMAVRTVDDRPVDVGAAYFTADSPAFTQVVESWVAAGLARPWTDTFHVATPDDGITGTVTGPVRYATPGGLRSLVEQLAVGLDVTHADDVESVTAGPLVDGEPYAAVALAMPAPQADDLLPAAIAEEAPTAPRLWEPALSLVTLWDERVWPALDGVFVHDSPVLTWVADDGSRRGDGAAVLVAHSDPVLAAAHLDDPAAAVPAMLDELRRTLRIDAVPSGHFVKRWSLAKPVDVVTMPFHLGPARVGRCGDGWHGRSRIESAYLSGSALGRGLRTLLGA
ncbi:MAG: NAD(P)-binding protein [Actinomycetota bacterium]|nr:NAD(P)-binding protein [Actinomycetota bacterium]